MAGTLIASGASGNSFLPAVTSTIVSAIITIAGFIIAFGCAFAIADPGTYDGSPRLSLRFKILL